MVVNPEYRNCRADSLDLLPIRRQVVPQPMQTNCSFSSSCEPPPHLADPCLLAVGGGLQRCPYLLYQPPRIQTWTGFSRGVGDSWRCWFVPERIISIVWRGLYPWRSTAAILLRSSGVETRSE